MNHFWKGFYKKAALLGTRVTDESQGPPPFSPEGELNSHILAEADGGPPLFRGNGVGVSYDTKPDRAKSKDDDKYEGGPTPDVLFPSSGLGAGY